MAAKKTIVPRIQGKIITCMAVDKTRHVRVFDLLMVDTSQYRHFWQGGRRPVRSPYRPLTRLPRQPIRYRALDLTAQRGMPL